LKARKVESKKSEKSEKSGETVVLNDTPKHRSGVSRKTIENGKLKIMKTVCSECLQSVGAGCPK